MRPGQPVPERHHAGALLLATGAKGRRQRADSLALRSLHARHVRQLFCVFGGALLALDVTLPGTARPSTKRSQPLKDRLGHCILRHVGVIKAALGKERRIGSVPEGG